MRNYYIADIVKQRGNSERFQFFVRTARHASKFKRQGVDPSQVHAHGRGHSAYRCGERFNYVVVEFLDTLDTFVRELHFCKVSSIESKSKGHHRDNDGNHKKTDTANQQGCGKSGGSAGYVAYRRPEKVLAPELEQPYSL